MALKNKCLALNYLKVSESFSCRARRDRKEKKSTSACSASLRET